jgi:hypothetical protein
MSAWQVLWEEIVHKRKGTFYSGLVIGVLAGLMVGAIGAAYSAAGKKAWDRFGDMFQAGYISGFHDCVRVAKAKDPQGYVSQAFVIPAKTKPTHFQVWINEAYKDPKMAENTIPRMLSLAGESLREKFGPEPSPAGLRALLDAMEARNKRVHEANKAAETTESAPAPSGGTPPTE